MAWMSVKDYASLKGISERAIQKAIAKGKHKVQEVPHPSRKDQVAYLVWTDEPTAELLANRESGEPTAELTGEPTGELLTNRKSGEPEATTDNQELTTTDNREPEVDSMDVMDSGHGDDGGFTVTLNGKSVAYCDSADIPKDHIVEDNKMVERGITSLAVIEEAMPDLRPRCKEIPLKYKDLVDAKVQIVNSAMESGDLDAWYNGFQHGLVCSGAKNTIGKDVSLRTVYRWVQEYKKEGAVGLCPTYSIESGRGRKVPEDVQNKLLKVLLNPNKVSVATAVNLVRDHYRLNKREIGCSYRTMLRWVDDWKAEHNGEWVMAREGMKAFREKVNRTVLRDWSMTNVGDAWVSDGHTIEVMLIDPRDGKPRKHEIVAWFDATSRMPVGAAINISENTEVIQLSFRNGCLFTGYKPLIVYVDNGKAYKSKYFNGKSKSAEDIENEITGVFSRLGIDVINSLPYNAKAKVIERWWLDLQEQVERLLPGWTGNHAMAKPANLKRDEKWIKQHFAHEALTIDQFKQIFEHWAMNIYGEREHPLFKGKTRKQVFMEGNLEIPMERRISPEELNFMLLVIDKKRINNQGITLNKTIYWHEELVRYVGRDLIVRWDFWDIRSILVYDERDQFICQAPMRRFQDPLVKLRGDESISKRSLEADLKEIKGIERKVKEGTGAILERVAAATDDMSYLPDLSDSGMLDHRPLMPELPQTLKTIDDRTSEVSYAPTPNSEDEELSDETVEQLRSLGLID